MKPIVVVFLVTVNACASLPPAPPQRADTDINASFGKTWDAVVDYFARSSIPIKTIDRASGLIAAETTRLSGNNSAYATCSNGFMKLPPEGGSFNTLVRGDSTRSIVRVTATWIVPTAGGSLAYQCVTSDHWEKQFESAIKAKAEAAAK